MINIKNIMNTVAQRSKDAAAPSRSELKFKTETISGSFINKHEVQIFHGEKKVGWLSATQESGSKVMLIDEAELAHGLRGQGLGKEMYNRLFSHAKDMGATSITSGGVVSEDAQKVWRSLAKHSPVSEKMGAAGPIFSLDVAKFVAKETHLAPGRAAAVEGLTEHGVAPILRKVLTHFGSAFQGIRPQMAAPSRFLKLVGATEESIRHTDIQHGRYQRGELQGLVDAWKSKKEVEPVEIFVDEFKNIVGAEGRHRALAAMKAGVAEIPIVIRHKPTVQEAEKLARTMMDCGEGSAICRAGTSQVPAMLKRTARVIKNAL